MKTKLELARELMKELLEKGREATKLLHEGLAEEFGDSPTIDESSPEEVRNAIVLLTAEGGKCSGRVAGSTQAIAGLLYNTMRRHSDFAEAVNMASGRYLFDENLGTFTANEPESPISKISKLLREGSAFAFRLAPGSRVEKPSGN